LKYDEARCRRGWMQAVLLVLFLHTIMAFMLLFPQLEVRDAPSQCFSKRQLCLKAPIEAFNELEIC
jgi:hypothetical protein